MINEKGLEEKYFDVADMDKAWEFVNCKSWRHIYSINIRFRSRWLRLAKC